jgi:glutathione S-transferase
MRACCQTMRMPARAITWMFAALNTMEPTIVDREVARLLEGHEPCYEQRLSVVEERIRKRLSFPIALAMPTG